MVVVARPIQFDENDPRPMLQHLDSWARRSLGSPEAWGSTLELCGQWSDYSARNQVLLASYGVATPVAGSATWARMESVDGRPCAIRSGEHGLPVRVPVLGEVEVVGDRTRASGPAAVADAHRWELVFAQEQLARAPGSGQLRPPAVPEMRDRPWAEAVRVASGRLLGRMPRRVSNPAEQLAELAGRVPLGTGRSRLTNEQRTQVAWLVTDRLGRAEGPMIAFDPSGLQPRERWRSLVDTRHAAGRVLSAVSFAIGVDLAASSLPRHELVDDREVAPARRNYLAPADVRALPLGVWTEVGPYTKGEWLARGVAGAQGRAAFLRVNERSYLAAYESRTGALWRLETTGRGAHHGLVAEGSSETIAEAKEAARQALRDRFPDVARAVEPTANTTVLSLTSSWAPLDPSADVRTEIRPLDPRVSAMVAAGPGGRWQTWTVVDGSPRQGPLAPSATEARELAEALARGTMLELASHAPERANQLVQEMASSGAGWNRADLVTVLGHRLDQSDRAELATTGSPQRLVELMAATGVVAPATMMRVLWAEGVGADTAASLVPAIGVGRAEAVRLLHEEWGVDRLAAGASIGATPTELREAGCTAREMLAAAPREELRRLDTRESTWMLAGPALLDVGYSVADAVTELARHAPNAGAFAAAVTAIVDDPVDALAFALPSATVADLSALTERFGLSVAEVAETLAAVSADSDTVVAVLTNRCDGDIAPALALTSKTVGLGATKIDSVIDTPMRPVAPTSNRQSAIDRDLAIVDL